MRKLVWALLLVFTFAVPWEFSLDLGQSLGNIARVVGLLVLAVAIPAVLQAGRMRTPGPMQWAVMAFYLWFCCSCFWTIESAATFEKLRAYLQEMMVVWIVWEFAESPYDLRDLLRMFVAGSWVLALLTLANFGSAEAIGESQIRFVADGQDPNDVARFLDIGFPFAALLVNCERRWTGRLLGLGYLPLGLVAVVLTASRGGFLASLLALAGGALLLLRGHAKGVVMGALALPIFTIALWFAVPHGTFARIATIPAQLQGGDLNQRMNIWHAGWQAFARAPWLGTGAGSFTMAAGTNPRDTAHNTALSIAVAGGLCGLFLFVAVVATAVRSALATSGPLMLALLTSLLIWCVASFVDTVEENRVSWLLLGIVALAGRLASEDRQVLEFCFAGPAKERSDEGGDSMALAGGRPETAS
jgi:O-antigen ligase